MESGGGMLKKYAFEFPGTKQAFLSALNQFRHDASYSGGTYYYLDDYIVRVVDDEIHFGVARGGHSGGYWFVPEITCLDGKTEFRGEIRFLPVDTRGTFRKAIDGIGDFLLFVLFLPICLLVWGYMFIEWLVRKLFNCPKPKQKTDEERLFDLMENYLGCVGK